MGLTSIEYLLFEGQNCVHEIIALRIEQATLTLAVKPQSQLHPPFTVQFHQVELLHEEVLDEDTAFPWEIIGFDAHHLGSGRWKFHLLCLEKELLWNSSWVRIVSTSIEHLVFQGQNLIHEVILLTIEQATLTLMVAPQSQWYSPFTVQFHQIEHLHEEVLDEDTRFPWHIIGFDSHALGSGQWEFILHCLEKEVVWNSSWPIIVSEMV